MTYSDETDYRAGCFRKLNTYFKLLWYTHFYTHNTYLPTYIRSRGWSVVLSAMDNSAGTADKVQRVDFDFVSPKTGAGKVYALNSPIYFDHFLPLFKFEGILMPF